MKEIYFATSNKNKFRETKDIIGNEINLKHFLFDHNEIRSDSLEEIARDAVEHAYEKLKKAVFVEDTGLFVNSLKGFPGSYSGWALEKIGCEGILRLVEGKVRDAEFRCCMAYMDKKGVEVFSSVCRGEISEVISGGSGFGYDQIFIPEGYTETFAQSIELKNKLSHRYKNTIALRNFLLY